MKLREIDISDILFERLKDYGAIKWHKNDNHSFYLKFKDCRLGSIRIANHRGRERYHYTYEIFKNDKDVMRKIEDTIQSVIRKSETLSDFDPNKFLVFDVGTRQYKEVPDYRSYKDAVLRRSTSAQ